MLTQSLYHTYKRYRTLQTDTISVLPIVILMPHSACNCRCVMCDIWKDNHNLKQLSENDILGLLDTFKKFDTKQVVMSGGEALLHPNFFRFCEILNGVNIKVTLLSTGLTLKRNAEQIVRHLHDVIVSIDGDESAHDRVRNITGAFQKIREGVQAIKSIKPTFRIYGRSVIHKGNFKQWGKIIDAADGLGLDQISFLPADVSSHAFNREVLWGNSRQQEILPGKDELGEFNETIETLIRDYDQKFQSQFIAEPPEKIRQIGQYYSAFYHVNPFPYKKCNAPWVSTVVEADGTVRPCFFHEAIGNVHNEPLEIILNSDQAIEFRKKLDMDRNDICMRCVCYLNLHPRINPLH